MAGQRVGTRPSWLSSSVVNWYFAELDWASAPDAVSRMISRPTLTIFWHVPFLPL